MPRTETPVATLTGSINGLPEVVPVAGDVANGNVISNYSPTMWLEVTNSGAITTYTVSVVTPATGSGRSVVDDVSTPFAANQVRKFGPFDSGIYGPNLEFNVSNAALTVAAYQLLIP
jgi:hypothetical protein